MKKIDMSGQAVLRRLKQVDQLRELCLSLMKAKKDSDEKKKGEAVEFCVVQQIENHQRI